MLNSEDRPGLGLVTALGVALILMPLLAWVLHGGTYAPWLAIFVIAAVSIATALVTTRLPIPRIALSIMFFAVNVLAFVITSFRLYE